MNKMYVCVVETPDDGKTVSRIYTRLDDAREWMRNRFLDFMVKHNGHTKENFKWSAGLNIEDGAVSAGVDGRNATGNRLEARAGELVELKVQNKKERAVQQIRVWDAEGHEIARYDAANPEGGLISRASANSAETVYVFDMPKKNIGKIEVSFIFQQT